MVAAEYASFLARKSQLDAGSGFEPLFVPKVLMDFQRILVEWAIRTGRSALFADCGMGKTLMQLVYAENVVRKTNGRVLILTPLSVASQTVEEAEKFGIEAKQSRDGSLPAKIVVTNYEKLHLFEPGDFAGAVCDESSILKDFDGVRKEAITEFMRRLPYRLLCTATAAPNDYVELGTSSEALGYLGHMDMLGRFFKNDEENLHPAFIGTKWRFKRHAEREFWRWVCSWARAVRRPSDIGCDDGPFVLPELVTREHQVEGGLAEGRLFSVPAKTLAERHEERRRSLPDRCELAAKLATHDRPAAVWCNLNDESDLLAKLIPGAEALAGSDSDERKEELFNAFRHGELRALVTKPKIAAYGLNWQHCADIVYLPTDSFEQYYQAVRRCWRFGQKRRVAVDLVTSEGDSGVLENLRRKADACSEMFDRLVAQMNDALSIDRSVSFPLPERIPAWLS